MAWGKKGTGKERLARGKREKRGKEERGRKRKEEKRSPRATPAWRACTRTYAEVVVAQGKGGQAGGVVQRAEDKQRAVVFQEAVGEVEALDATRARQRLRQCLRARQADRVVGHVQALAWVGTKGGKRLGGSAGWDRATGRPCTAGRGGPAGRQAGKAGEAGKVGWLG